MTKTSEGFSRNSHQKCPRPKVIAVAMGLQVDLKVGSTSRSLGNSH